MSLRVRLLAALATLALPATFLAAQMDFVRRYRIGILPQRYWIPQLSHIWVPGLAVTVVAGTVAFALHRRQRGE